ncbi:MAG: hypothetical protein WCH57_06215 [Verrucomicrobiota bacterium]
MITKRICFVLGAGASMDFGFPSGSKLLTQICENLLSPERSGQPFWKQFGSTGREFAKELQYSGKNSIDAFLESRSELITIGKMAIAGCLIPRENPDSIFNLQLKGNNWYDYLFEQMAAPLSKFGDNEVSFITYNYDRSLEFYLETVLRKSYGASDIQITDIFKRIPIVHLHGTLGDLPFRRDRLARDFTPILDDMSAHLAANSIKIIHENISKEPQFKEAAKLLRNAEELVFLGFGYHETNLKRLRLDKYVFADIRGTAYDMTQREINAIANSFDERLIPENTRILPFLRETGIIAKERRKLYPQIIRSRADIIANPLGF